MKRWSFKISGKVRIAAFMAGLSVLCACNMRMKYYTPEDKIVAFNWTLHAYEGKAIDLHGFPKGAPVLRFFTDSTLILFTGCQHTKGFYTMTDLMFDIDIDTLQISCETPGTQNLIRFLNLSNEYLLSKEKLSIRLNGTEMLSFFEK